MSEQNTIPGALESVRNRWRIDKAVSGQTVVIVLLSFMGASLMNLVALIWMARGFVADQEQLVNNQRMDRERIIVLETARQAEAIEKVLNASRMAVLEDRTANTQAAVLRIEADVKQLISRRSQP